MVKRREETVDASKLLRGMNEQLLKVSASLMQFSFQTYGKSSRGLGAGDIPSHLHVRGLRLNAYIQLIFYQFNQVYLLQWSLRSATLENVYIPSPEHVHYPPGH